MGLSFWAELSWSFLWTFLSSLPFKNNQNTFLIIKLPKTRRCG
jgi:hypothetical protein